MVRKYSLFISIFFLVGAFIMGNPMSSNAQQESYGVGSWDSDSLGNHRAVVTVSDSVSKAANATITWRRKDDNPQDKRITVVDAETNQKINNVFRIDINRITGDIVFEPTSGAGTYYIYYMPYNMKGRIYYPEVNYLPPENTAELEWLQDHGLQKKSDTISDGAFAKAKVQEIQSIDWFNSFYPMEIIASREEVEKLEKEHDNKSYLLFPEKRTNSIRMYKDLPYRWIKEGPSTNFQGKANRGEFYAFQVGLYASKRDIGDVEITFSDLKHQDRSTEITAKNFSSFNTEGTSWEGKYFDKTVPVKEGRVQPFWLGVQIPKSADPGMYTGSLTVKPTDAPSRTVDLSFEVVDKIIEDGGDDDIWRLSRLQWLNSGIAMNHKVVEPFTSIKREKNKLSILGRSIELGDNGLPQQVKSYFSPAVTKINEKSRSLMSSPLRFVITDASGSEIQMNGKGVSFTKQDKGLVAWTSKGQAAELDFDINGKIEPEGYMHYKVTVEANRTISVDDIRMEIPVKKEAADYMMGLGQKGGERPQEYHWKWDQTKHQEGAWIGDVNIGFMYQLRDTNYVRPLNTNFYQKQPLNLPPSWYNQGKGGTDITEENDETVLVKAYSGERTIRKGEKVNFVFNLYLTPFKKINASKHWENRYYHAYNPVSQVAKTGASVINIHHANEVNPYINYPFINTKEMKEYVDRAHLKDMDVKIYYTIRELTNRAPELFALRSMGNEFISSGDGGGPPWLQEHLKDDYIPGWFVPRLKDAAVVNSGMSRWHNFYVEGLDWLVQNIGIDGLYIDDLAFDRTTMKRVRKVLNRGDGDQLIDMHSANQYNERDGYTNSALLYMEHFPYIDRLWFGEYFEYDQGPDYWLTETSGIPFGLMGEMLQGGGNPWRGMIYGMTGRASYTGITKPIWKLWDKFGIQEAEMRPYWSPKTPIKSGNDKVKATSYVRKGNSTLLVLASWAENAVEVTPKIDWDAIGIDAEQAIIKAPEIEKLQSARQYQVGDPMSIAPAKGKMLIIEEK